MSTFVSFSYYGRSDDWCITDQGFDDIFFEKDFDIKTEEDFYAFKDEVKNAYAKRIGYFAVTITILNWKIL